jgi:hypothetical protein
MTTHPWPVLIGCVALAVVASLYTVQHMEFVTGRNDLISADKRYVQLDDEYSEEFMGIDQIVVVVEPRDVQEGKNFVARLGAQLAQDTDHVAEVFYHIDTSSLDGKKLLYLSPDDLRSLHDNVKEYGDLIRDLTTAPGVNTLLRSINQQVSSGMVSHLVSGFLGLDSSKEEKKEQDKPVKISFLSSLLQEMNRALESADYRYQSPWTKFFGDAEELSDEGYLVSDNRRFVFLMVEPKTQAAAGFSEKEESIASIRKAVQELRKDFPPGLKAE